jgi:hypothetical protein
VVTEETVAVNAALVAPAGTTTELGNATALLLLLSDTATPPDGAPPVRDTVQASLPAPVNELLVQLSALSVPAVCPVPLNAMFTVEAFVARLTAPATEPATVGSKLTVRFAV